MPKLILIINCLVLSTLIFAQKEQKRKWAISLTPAFIPFSEKDLGVQPGIEYKLSDHLRVLTELTFAAPTKTDSSELGRRYLRIKPELRFTSNLNQKYIGYIGLQMGYSFRNFTNASGSGFYYDDLSNDSVYYYKSARIKSPILTISFQLGTILYYRKRIVVDFFAGIGPKFVDTEISDVINKHPGTRTNKFIKVTYSYERMGNSLLLYLNTGLRIMYNFNIPHK